MAVTLGMRTSSPRSTRAFGELPRYDYFEQNPVRYFLGQADSFGEPWPGPL